MVNDDEQVLRRLGWAAALIALPACSALDGRPSALIPVGAIAAQTEESAGPPRYASYECGEGRTLTVENFLTSALVVPPDGPGFELPARPAGQSRSFRAGSQALVLDERRAVLSREGRPALTCSG